MIITTTESVAGYVISEYLGAAYGAESYTVKGNLNGELTDLDQAYSKAFEVAKAQMSAKAELLGADAVIGIKSTMKTVGATNIVIVAVNGTAVKAVKEEAKAEQSGVLSVQVVEPVTVANPVTEVAITNPVTEVTVANPVTEVTVANPVTEVAVTNPVTEVTVANPVKEVTVANPVKDVNVVNAVKLADSIKVDVPVAAVAATAAPVVEEEPTVVNLEDILEKPAPQAVVPEPVVEEPVAAEPVVAEPVVEETEPESKEEEAPSLFSDALAGAGKIFIPDPVVEVSSAAPIPPKKEEEKQEEKQEEEPAPAVPEKSSIPGVQPVVPPVKKVVEEEKTSEMPLEDKLLLILKENGRKMDMMDIVNELESKVGAFEIIELLEKAVALGKCKKDGKQYYVD